MHSVTKHLVKRSTSRPTAESILYLSFLRRLMAKFIERGNLDFTLSKNAVALAERTAGLVTRSAANRESKRKVKKGAHLSALRRFLNTKSRLAKQLRHGKQWSRHEQQRSEERWRDEFNAMLPDEQSAFFAMHGRGLSLPEQLGGGDSDDECGICDAELAAPQLLPGGEPDLLDILSGSVPVAEETAAFDIADCGRTVWPLKLSDDIWPLSREIYSSHLRKVAASSAQTKAATPGVSKCAASDRPRLRKQLLVDDASRTPVPDGPCSVRLACSDVHPGLCKTKHADILDESLKMAARIRQFVKETPGGVFLRVVGQKTGAPPLLIHICMGTVRHREPAVAVFAKAEKQPEIGERAIGIEFEEAFGKVGFQFTTCYKLAATCLSDKDLQSVKIQEVNTLSATAGYAMIKQDGAVSREQLLFPAAAAQAGSQSASSREDVDLLDILLIRDQRVRAPASSGGKSSKKKQKTADVDSDDSVSDPDCESDLECDDPDKELDKPQD